jgi:GNAT superfamily N-acetyltransferase
MTLRIEPFDSRKHRPDFCCGQDSLDNYIRHQASQDSKKRVSTVFVMVDAPEVDVLAYYTLSSYVIDITALDTAIAKRLPRYPRLPATLLGRLAVHKQQQGKGIGELMLVDALKKALHASTQVTSLAVMAEALDQNALNFYLKYGFQQFSQEPMKLYFPVQSIAQL